MTKPNDHQPHNNEPNDHHLHDSQPTTSIITTPLSHQDNAGHSDHWALVGADATKLQTWLGSSLERAVVPVGLASCKTCDEYFIIAANDHCHIKQVFALDDGKPSRLVNIFPAVNSPYGVKAKISELISCHDSQDAILRLTSSDGTTIYAFDQLYALNHCHYQAEQTYYVNLSAWAYDIDKSEQDEVVVVDDPKAIRYHRAFNDIVAKAGGQVPDDINAQIETWQADGDEPLAPVEINLGHSCIYLFGEVFGQQDEAWCQGQVLGKSETSLFDQAVTLFDVVILREMQADPMVVRIAAISNAKTQAIHVHDYIQANIWLQAAIYQDNQHA